MEPIPIFKERAGRTFSLPARKRLLTKDIFASEKSLDQISWLSPPAKLGAIAGAFASDLVDFRVMVFYVRGRDI